MPHVPAAPGDGSGGVGDRPGSTAAADNGHGWPAIGFHDPRDLIGGALDRLRGEGAPALMCWPGEEAELELIVYRQLYGPSRTVERLDPGDGLRRTRVPRPSAPSPQAPARTPHPLAGAPEPSVGRVGPHGWARAPQPHADPGPPASQRGARRVPARFRRVPAIAGLLNRRDPDECLRPSTES